MKLTIELMKALSDPLRVRLLLLLARKELSVCQLMGITGASQPLISRNLSILKKLDLLKERREGKLRFYNLSTDLPPLAEEVIDALKRHLENDRAIKTDLATLRECTEFQKKVGRCDMETFKEFIKRHRKKGGYL
ncbi:MAG: ArsR family transcriptional regulator [Nitrospirae bacterium]|nr:MAG: ArsR family transcriptional regulator [Nitrospirota bacterium]